MFAVRCSALLLQILRYAQKDIPCHHRRSRCVVILNEAAGEVKDLEYPPVLGPVPHWQPLVIPKEICAGKMPLKAYIEGCRRISQHFSGDMHPDDTTGNVYRWLRMHISHPSSASARMDAVSASIGKKGKVDELISSWIMRRDAARTTSLRTGFISRDTVSDGLLNRFFADAMVTEGLPG